MSLDRAFTSLKARDWQGVLAALEGFAPPDEPSAARAAAWSAQALEGLGRLEEAERQAALATRLAKKAGEAAGVEASRALHQRVLGALAAAKALAQERAADAALAELDDEALVARAEDDTGAAALLLRKGNALADRGEGAAAAASARAGLSRAERAGAPRERVLLLLLLARAEPEAAPAHVQAAHAVADAAGDWNLVTAVAKAARAAGVRLVAPTW